MVNIDYDNNINNEPYDQLNDDSYDQLNNEPYYNPYEGKYLQNISNNITDITISGNIMPLEYFILSDQFFHLWKFLVQYLQKSRIINNFWWYTCTE